MAEILIPKKLNLIKNASSYKMIIPEKVEEKIRYLQRKYPSTEWSGVLFYTYEGSFETNDLVITCQDIFPMDLGNATYTEYNMSSDVTKYIAENPDLFTCMTGLVHSHHSMSAFFSGTDLETLRSEGQNTNCFVSLIVNNAGTYCAAITRKIKEKKEVTTYHFGKSYEFFGAGEVKVDSVEAPEVHQKCEDVEAIEYFDLEIDRHIVANELDYLDKRFEEIKEQKAKKAFPSVPWTSYKEYKTFKNSNYNIPSYTPPVHKQEEPTLWDKSVMDELKVPEKKSDEGYIPNEQSIRKAVIQMLTGIFFVDPDKFNLDEWIKKHMDRLYDTTFGASSNPNKFNEWCDFITEFILDNWIDYDPNFENFPQEESDGIALIAEALIEHLSNYLYSGEYITQYISSLEQYLI